MSNTYEEPPNPVAQASRDITVMSKRIVILGAGESGAGAAVLAQQQGYDVFVSESGSIKDKYRQILTETVIQFEEGSHDEERILAAEEVMKSPGIPEKHPLVKKIRAEGHSRDQ